MPDYLYGDHPERENNDPNGCWGNSCCFIWGLFVILTIVVIGMDLLGYHLF
jgi:hypothetical protein